MKNNSINIFLGIAPNHITNFELLIEKGIVQGKNLLLNPENSSFNNKNWDHVIADKIVVNNTKKGRVSKIRFQFLKIKGYKRLIKNTKVFLSEYDSFSIYYANLEDALSNYFFFSFRKEAQKERIIVEDGALNYYSYTEEKLPKFAYFLKIILANLMGIPFKRIKGDVSGIEYPYVKKQYVRAPKLACYPEKSLQLPYRPIDFQINVEHILIIGQEPYSNFISEDKYEEGLRNLCEIILNHNGSPEITVYYKPHRHGSFSNAKKVLKQYFRNYKILKREDVIEELIESVAPAQIFSFDSSSLLNIKIAAQNVNGLKMTAYLFFSAKLLHLYRQINIDVIEPKK